MKIADKKMLEKIQSRVITKPEFDYDTLFSRPLVSLLSQYDVDRLYNIATSVRYAGNAQKKFKAIDDIVHPRGFIKISAGTNRICYGHLEDPSICIKVAEDKTGIKDNPREFMNQLHLKPFCTKVFEVTPDGTVGLFERVRGIQSREEFLSVADQIFELIDTITGKYILADFGTKYFMNYGFRERNNFGPVILDFPYLYETDAQKLVCKKPVILPTGEASVCGGLIDYDAGFNNLICKKCGAVFRAVEIAKYVNDSTIILKGNGKNMEGLKLSIRKGDKVTKLYDENIQAPVDHVSTAPRMKNVGDQVILSAKRVPKKNFKPQYNQKPVQKPVEKTIHDNKEIKVEQQPANNSNNVIIKKATINLDNSPVSKTKNTDFSISASKNVMVINTPVAKVDAVNSNNTVLTAEAVANAINAANNAPNPNVINAEDKSLPVDVKHEEVVTLAVEEIPEKDEEQWSESSFDLENKVVTYESNLGNKITVPMPVSMVENLTAADELEKAKADLLAAEDTVAKSKQSNLEQDNLVHNLNVENNDLVEKLAAAEKKIEELNNNINEAAVDKVETINALESQIADIKAKNEELSQNLDNFYKDYDDIEAKYNDSQKRIKELETDLAQANSVTTDDSNEVETEIVEDANTDEEEITSNCILEINGTWCPLQNIINTIPDLQIGDKKPEDRVIVFNDGEGGMFTDQFGNIIVITSINGISLNDKDLQFKSEVKKHE